MKVYVYYRDRSEEGMAAPVIRRLQRRGMLTEAWQDADIVLIPGDRREAIRFALEVYEAGKLIAHHGWCDVSETAREVHYDHRYRDMLSAMSSISLPIRDYPTMVDDLPSIMMRPFTPVYRLVAWNAVPWEWEDMPEVPGDAAVVAAWPGNDGNRDRVVREIAKRGWLQLEPMSRAVYLSYMKHAEEVWGNSSALCYEAPLWHPNKRIHLVGKRNAGRSIVRWTRKESPSDLLIERLIEWNGESR